MFVHSQIPCCSPDIPGTVGIVVDTYDNDVAGWDVPGSQWYVPPPDQVDCSNLSAGVDLLNNYLVTWNDRLGLATHTFFPNLTQIDNCRAMIDLLTQRLKDYQAKESYCLTLPPPVSSTPGDLTTTIPGTTDATGGDTGGQPTTTGGNNAFLWVALAAGGMFVLLKSKKQRRSKK